ncbi:MAG: regulatory protein RecX [Clostridia bacterium]|nr:regulatory protein RecX [Clostridia bacterium]
MRISICSLYTMSAGEETGVTFECVSDDGFHSSKSTFVISSKQYLTLGLSRGDCSAELYDTVAYSAEIWSAVRRGVSILGYGACSEKALRSKLVMKGFSKEVASDAVEYLVGMGLVRPIEDALCEARKLASRLWGKRRIVSGLYEKGYSAEAVGFALASLEDEGVDYIGNCCELIRKRYSASIEDASERRKAFSALARYGYSLSEIKESYFSFKKEK